MLAGGMKQYIRPFFMWSFGAMAFLIQYGCRVSPSGMLDPIMQDFMISAAVAGYLGSAFYYTYIAMQLFVGRIVDAYPPHRVLFITSIIFLMSNQLFSESLTIGEAIFARGLMGMMGAFSFVVTMKLAMIWFENRFLGVFSGLTQVSGMIGVVFGNYIVNISLIGGEWRSVIKVFSWFLCLLVLLMLIFMKEKPTSSQKPEKTSILEGLKLVWANPQSWYNAIFAGLIYLPTAAFGEYWGIQYLTKTSLVLSKDQAMMSVNMIFVGWAIGGILMGWFSDYIQKRKPLLLFSPLICLGLLLPVLYMHQLSAIAVGTLMFLYGLFNAALVVSYAISGEINQPKVAGVSIAFCNMLSVLLGSLALPLVGYLVDSYQALGVNEAMAYEKSVYLFPLAMLLAFVIANFVKETNCQVKV